METRPAWADEPTATVWKQRYQLLEQTYAEAIQELVLMRAWEENCEQFRRMYKLSEENNRFLRGENERLRGLVGDPKPVIKTVEHELALKIA